MQALWHCRNAHLSSARHYFSNEEMYELIDSWLKNTLMRR